MKTYKVFFESENKSHISLVTGFNGSIEEAENYYLNKWFNLGNTDKDLMFKGIEVVEVA